MDSAVAQLELIQVDLAIDEILHGGPDPSLPSRILREAARRPAAPANPTPRGRARRAPRRRWRRLAEAALVAGVIAAIVLLLIPEPAQDQLPGGVLSNPDAQYRAFAGRVDVTEGWYVLTEPAPEVQHEGNVVWGVEGKAVVFVGDIPTSTMLRAQGSWLSQHQITEEAMRNANWIKAGSLAICLLAGSAWVNTDYVDAQARVVRKVEKDEKKKETPEETLERLDREIKKLKEQMDEAQKIEDNDQRAKRIERIQNAITEKEAEYDKAQKAKAEADKAGTPDNPEKPAEEPKGVEAPKRRIAGGAMRRESADKQIERIQREIKSMKEQLEKTSEIEDEEKRDAQSARIAKAIEDKEDELQRAKQRKADEEAAEKAAREEAERRTAEDEAAKKDAEDAAKKEAESRRR